MSTASGPISERGGKIVGTGCLRLFFVPFLLVGAFFFWRVTVEPLWQISQARGWVAAPCTILSSEISTSRGSKGARNYRAKIRYAYRFDDRDHTSERVSFAMPISNRRAAKATVQRFPRGSKTVCHVDPHQPQEAVLDRGLTHDLWFGAIGLLFFGVGAGGILYAARLAKPRSHGLGPVATISRLQRKPFAGVGSRGPEMLRPVTGHAAKVGFAAVISLFWNGVVLSLGWQAWQSHAQGRGEWFPLIFLLPFVLIGLAMVGFFFHSLLALLNPRIRVTAPSALLLGDTMELHWETSGGAARIRRLRIAVEGCEEVTLRRGKSTRVERSVFASFPLADTGEPAEIRSGTCRAIVPANLMHSFDFGSNRIVWMMRVRGDCLRFPDIDDEYRITILPLPVRT